VPHRHAPGRRSRGAARSLVLLGLAVLLPCLAVPSQADPALDTGPRMVAEWEPAVGSLVRWPLGIPMDLARELARDHVLYTLVESAGQENQARAAFGAAGIDLARVEFIRGELWSMWTRDWGPQAVFDASGELGYADPWFNGYPWVPGCIDAPTDAGTGAELAGRSGRGYEEDDALPAVVAAHLGRPHLPLSAYLTGGNVMTDGLGIAWSTSQMLAENAPYLDEATFRLRAAEVLGIADYRFTIAPETYGIQHIDCYAKLLDEETVLVKEVPAWHPEHQCCEEVAAAFAAAPTAYGRPYTVHRIFCDVYDGDAAAAYTNSLILDRKVLVPLFGIAADAQALDTYRAAMPGYEVLGFPDASWYDYDALHCRVMGIFDPGMLRLLHARLDSPQPAGAAVTVAAVVDDRSGAGLPAGEQRVLWRLAGEAAWNPVDLAPTAADSLAAQIPAQAPGAVVEYRLEAADASGRTASLPRGARPAAYAYATGTTVAAPAGPGVPSRPALALSAAPNPFNPRVILAIAHDLGGHRAPALAVTIHDLRGRCVRRLHDGPLPAGARLTWDGADDRGRALPSGVYLVLARGEGAQATARLVLQR